MKAFLVTTGVLFGLMVVVHLVRVGAEPRMAKDPWFIVITVAAGVMSLWAWRLLWRSRRS
jgi:hypothetical protein